MPWSRLLALFSIHVPDSREKNVSNVTQQRRNNQNLSLPLQSPGWVASFSYDVLSLLLQLNGVIFLQEIVHEQALPVEVQWVMSSNGPRLTDPPAYMQWLFSLPSLCSGHQLPPTPARGNQCYTGHLSPPTDIWCIFKQNYKNSSFYFIQMEEFCMYCSVPWLFQEVIF